MQERKNQSKEIERHYNDTRVTGKEVPGEWIVECIMKTSTSYWLAVVRKENAETQEDVLLTRHSRLEGFKVGQKVKVIQSVHLSDFFVSTKIPKKK